MFSKQGVRLGPMRLTAYGACAAAGVIAAMALSGRAARRVGLSGDAAWDAGLFAILSCFVASRLLLVVSDPVAFAHFPLLVLSLPSLTIAGIAAAGAMTWAYLRRKHLPILRLLDVFAPCGAVVAAFLELGHWMDNSELGMPVFRASHAVAFRPVSLYGIAVSLGIAGLLWTRVTRESRPGRVAGLGLMLGGLAAFGLDTVSLPSDFFDSLWLEPGQMVALGAMIAGALLWTFAPESDRTGGARAFVTAPTPRSQKRDLGHPHVGSDEPVAAGRGEVR